MQHIHPPSRQLDLCPMIPTFTKTDIRRLAVTRQRLAGSRPSASKDGVLEIFRDLRAVQIDPLRAVERTQLLVLFSRLGPFDPALLDQLQQEDRAIFEAWAHAASYVLTEDYPLHYHWMHPLIEGGVWGQRVRDWMEANDALRQHVLDRLAAEGPLATADFEDMAIVPWESTGWNAGRNVTRMLDFLNGNGQVLAVGRSGNNKFWHLTEKWLHEWADHEPWSEEQVVRTSIEHSLRGLGVATVKQIKNHFVRGRYPDLETHLMALVEAGIVVPVQVVDDLGQPLKDDWYVHAQDLPTLEALHRGEGWQPRTVFLSPFDNLICDRDRTQLLWDFYYRIEIYVPAAKRQYGYYVLPILHGDRLIGRMDSKFDRKKGVYAVNALYVEEGETVDEITGQAIGTALAELVEFIGAKRVAYGENIPEVWRRNLPVIE